MARFNRRQYILITDWQDFRQINDEDMETGFIFTNNVPYHAIAVTEVIDHEEEEVMNAYATDLKNWEEKRFNLNEYVNMKTSDRVRKLVELLDAEKIPYEIEATVIEKIL